MVAHYILIDTFWENSPNNWFGPYYTRAAAEEAISESEIFDSRKKTLAVDVRNQTRCNGVFTATESAKFGRNERNTYQADILPVDTDALREVKEYWTV